MTDSRGATTRRRWLGQAGALACLPLAAQAQGSGAWPARPITYIVPYSPGGGTDMVARILAPHMGQVLGQPIVVANKAGAGGNIGSAALAQAAPDGYTIGGGSIASHAINGSLYTSMPYDMVRDFTPITVAGTMPNLLIVQADTPYRSVADLVRAGKGADSKLSYASAGNGTSQHLCMELFKLQSGMDAVHVPYKGAGPALQAVMSGETQCSFENLAVAAPQLASGRIRALAITSARRMQAWPEVPTVAESGYPGFDVTSWQALFAPAGLAQPLLARLNAAAVAALEQPQTRERFATLGMDVTPMTPQQASAFQRAEVDKWAKVIQAARLTLG
ncbi:tripartite tricarboxylate transporter substrate binding protein [Pulveribacter sp.]|uniref:Bug family tripartite tricarboxylate transporter substrate binding protein n=1 Tax=Pulveribacter sp. TaxID=2678893 RepID=UPI00289C6306|nr:tripartite tricarboxylate transporter substrate binding protein [Pulveribacter sp.]